MTEQKINLKKSDYDIIEAIPDILEKYQEHKRGNL